MRTFPKIFAIALCAASFGAAHSQTTAGVTKMPSSVSVPSGMNFAYDGAKGQITATGIHLNPQAISKATAAPTTGTIVVTINIKIASTFTAGTTYHCSVYAIGGAINTDTDAVDGGIETANTITTGMGTASCTLKIPYSWSLSGAAGGDTGLILAFGASAVNVHDEVQRSTLQLDGIENLPASGTVSKYVFDVAL